MTHEEAVARCEELNRDEPGERHWLPKRVGDDEWEAVAVSGPGLWSHGPLKEGAESKPMPSEAPDPRPSLFRNVPPYGA